MNSDKTELDRGFAHSEIGELESEAQSVRNSIDRSDFSTRSQRRSNFAVYLVVVYMAWFITTPLYSPRFAFLAESGFERLLAGVLIVFSALLGKWENLFKAIPLLLATLFVWMLISSTFTDYNHLDRVIHWRETYWKALVFFACLTLSVRNIQQAKIVVIGVAAVLFLYQLYSWFDFLNGGSYVYRQGMKRMKGTWAAAGHGAGNAWGYLGLMGIPLSIAWYRMATSRLTQYAAACFFVVTALCIVFSGTRGALISGSAYVLFLFRKQLFKPKYIAVVLLVGTIALPMLPKDVKHRFISIVIPVDEFEATSADKMASDSAKGRLGGLIDGFKVASESPLFGVGPGASAQAALELRQREGRSKENDGPSDLHNLYGQIPAELGFVGLGLWLMLVASSISNTRRVQSEFRNLPDSESVSIVSMSSLVLGLFAVFLIYGMAGHTLYGYQWLFLFGLANALSTIEY